MTESSTIRYGWYKLEFDAQRNGSGEWSTGGADCRRESQAISTW